MKDKYLKALYDLIDRTLEPYKKSMTEEEYKRFRYENNVFDLISNDYEYTFEEECGYWLESLNPYQDYINNCYNQKWYRPEVANELKKICGIK